MLELFRDRNEIIKNEKSSNKPVILTKISLTDTEK